MSPGLPPDGFIPGIEGELEPKAGLEPEIEVVLESDEPEQRSGGLAESELAGAEAYGDWLPEAEIETAQKRAIERAVLLATCRAAGAKNDPAKAQDLLKAGPAKIPRAAFVEAIATALFEESQLYGHNKLDKPDTMKTFCARAQEALKTVPVSKESQDLDKKIQAALKKAKA